MSEDYFQDDDASPKALRAALAETVINVERLVEEAERVLRRAKGRLAAFDIAMMDD